jgi:hypothetical protein
LKKVPAVLTAIVALWCLGAAPAWADGIVWGANDDTGKYQPADGPFWTTLLGVGMTSNTITLRWNEATATGFDGGEQAFLAPALAAAAAAGVSVTFDVYPRHAAALSDPGNIPRFAAWLTQLAETYPTVREYVVMNECNTSLFANPQYADGANVSAPECGAFLAAGYDALKAVDPGIFVWGLGLSPRGNPVPKGRRSPRATDPIDWLRFLGDWYRASGRSEPLMDGLDVHPYPIPQSLPFAQGYKDPDSYSVSNLSRVYSAFYAAFAGTAQPTVGPGKLPVSLNEVGIQTVPSPAVASAYTGRENSPGVNARTGSEAYQADWYRSLIDTALCDADIAKVNIFELVDEQSLTGWQSGLFFRGYVPKRSATVFADELEATGNRCPTGDAARWSPAGTTAGVAPAKRTKAGKARKKKRAPVSHDTSRKRKVKHHHR